MKGSVHCEEAVPRLTKRYLSPPSQRRETVRDWEGVAEEVVAEKGGEEVDSIAVPAPVLLLVLLPAHICACA